MHIYPPSAQVRGDCVELQCTATGEVIEVVNPSDVYDDGNECTSDVCDETRPRNLPLSEGATCPQTGFGRCNEGRCRECVATNPLLGCVAGLACDGYKCVPGHCVNTTFDPSFDETDYNCGGVCNPCPGGDRCASGSDCLDGVCKNGICAAPRCDDGVKNGMELGVDCAAPGCPLCGFNQGCAIGADCISGVCWAGVCQTETCFDGVQNGDEQGVDCGGWTCDACAP